MNTVYVWVGIFLCLSQSAMFSGLNLACFSVSRLQLEIEASANNEDAIKVLSLREDSNFLLTTILWGTEKRIIAHVDLLRRLFEGVFSSPPNPG